MREKELKEDLNAHTKINDEKHHPYLTTSVS
jgi:hypothetical protein